jgi:hypothetical protein
MSRQHIRISSEASVRLPNGREVRVGGTRRVEIEPAAPADDRPTATVGFGSVRWKGKLYWFTSTDQRMIVAHLWQAAEAGEPFVPAAALLDAADLPANLKLKDVFRDMEAWGDLIVHGPAIGGPVGTFALAWAAKV